MAGKAGIHNEQELDRLQPQAYLGNLFAAHLGTAITMSILILSSWLLVVLSWWGLIVAITLTFAAGLLVLTLRRRYRRASLSYRQHSLTYRYGWFIKHSYYVLYDSIKDATITAYPWTQFGTIRFNIAGEQAQSDQKSKPNHITARYLPNRPEHTHFHNHIFDQLLLRRPDPQQYQQLLAVPPTQTVIHQSGPSLKNALGAASLWFLGVFIVLFLTIASIFPEPSNQQGLVGLFIILAIAIIVSLLVRLWVRRISYIIEDSRTLRRSGVIYRTQTSIIYPKLDYIKHGQGFANKLFRNGNLYLYTTGSQAAELTFKNAPDYQELHRQLKAYYET